MRIRRLRIDGYGCFSRFSPAGLEPGLTVFFGPNEAGKSTLLQFLREMLFAPWSGRNHKLSNPPLLGGAHGGALSLEGPGGVWQLEKHLRGTRMAIRFLGPGGQEAGEADLRALLGNADPELFRGAFTFNLADMVSLSGLNRGELQTQLASATQAGAGAGAPAALRTLQELADDLFRPRAPSVLGDLLNAHRELRRRKAKAVQEAARLPELFEKDRRFEAEESLRQQQRADLRALDLRLDRLIQYRRLTAEIERLEAQAAALRVEDRLDEAAGTVARLRMEGGELGGPSGLETAEAGEMSALEQKITEDRRRLGPEWNDDARHRLISSLELERELEALEKKLTQGVQEIAAAEASLGGAGQAHAEARHALSSREQRLRDLGTEPLPAEELRDQATTVNALREQWRSVRQLRQRLDETRQRLADAQSWSQKGEALAARHQFGPLLLLLAVAAGAAGVWAWSLKHFTEAGFLGLMVLILGWLAWRTLPGPSALPAGPNLAESRRQNQEALRELETALEAEQAGAEKLGLTLPLTPESLAASETRIRGEEERRRAWDAAVQDTAALRQAEERAAGYLLQARRRLDEASRRHAEVSEEWAEWCRGRGASPDLSPPAVRTLAQTVARLQDNLARLEDLRRRREARRLAVEQWRERATQILLQTDHPLPARAAELPAALDSLALRIEKDQEVRKALFGLQESRRATEKSLQTALGDAEAREALARDAALGDEESWTSRRGEIAARLQELDQSLRQLAGERGALADQIRILTGSADLAELAQEESSLIREIGDAYGEWLVLRTAHQLIEGTVLEYQRTHQPSVLRHAGAAMEELTKGRYQRLEARQEGGFAACPAEGPRKSEDELSRGTLEQLYLALRIGLALHLAERGIDLPLVMDDVLVNFDEPRQQAAAALIGGLARGRQVLFFTCHPSTAAMLSRYGGQVSLPGPERGRAGSSGNG